MVRYYGWYSNRTGGDRAKREAGPAATGTVDLDLIDLSECHPPAHPLEKVPRAHQVEDPDYDAEPILAIKKAFDENDITIPFPIRTLDFREAPAHVVIETDKKKGE